MNETKLLNAIYKSVYGAVNEAFNELGIENKVKTIDSQNAFKKTEQILWNYPMFKDVIKSKVEQIEEIQEHGVQSKSKSILEYHAGSSDIKGLETTEENVQNAISSIVHDIEWLQSAIVKIENALEFVKYDACYDILERYYFNRENIADIAILYDVEPSTISKWKNKLVRKMSCHLFPKDVVGEMLEV